MNPLGWRREHQLAWFLTCILGGMAGLLFAWFTSLLYILSRVTVSGEFADSQHLFFAWLPNWRLYWLWPMIGFVFVGTSFYIFRLLKSAR